MSSQFSLDVIKVATNNFNDINLLGVGGEGAVYKGCIQIGGSDSTVAIKVLTSNTSARFEEEIKLVSNLHHANVLPLKGYCNESKHMILVYEYMCNGSLFDNLYPKCSLDWTELLHICIDSARGLEYLHRGTSPQRIIHRDVKPENILLGENLVAKISDFGLLKAGLSSNRQESNPIRSNLRGTFNYYAPEYVFKGEITTKIDVYSFGVVLFEVLCRQKREWPLHDERNNESITVEVNIEEVEIGVLARRNIVPSLKHQISVKCLDKFIDIVKGCLHIDPSPRFSMVDEVSMLEESLKLQKNKSSYVLYFSSYNSTSENIENDVEDSLLVRVILKSLQVNIEEKNVSKYEGVYRAELSQIVGTDPCLPLLFIGVDAI